MVTQQQQIDFTPIVNELANRLRILEAKQSIFAEKLLVMNQNMIQEYKRLVKDIKNSRDNIAEVEKSVDKIRNVVKHFSEEAGKFARQDDVRVLQKYVQFWNPIKYVTEAEVEQIVARAHGKKIKPLVMTEVESESESETIDSLFGDSVQLGGNVKNAKRDSSE